MTKNAAATLAILSTIFSACDDPCEPVFTEDTLVIIGEVCPFTGGDNTSGDSTSGTSSTTADPVTPLDMGPAPLPVCIAIPAPGDAWGPCDAADSCAPGLDCKATPMGSVCLGACDPNAVTVCDAGVCLGGTCEAGIDACVAPCHAVGDPCPLPGMVCDFNGGAPLCVHPS